MAKKQDNKNTPKSSTKKKSGQRKKREFNIQEQMENPQFVGGDATQSDPPKPRRGRPRKAKNTQQVEDTIANPQSTTEVASNDTPPLEAAATNYDPLTSQPVKERDYTKPNVSADTNPNLLVEEIPEMSFDAPPLQEFATAPDAMPDIEREGNPPNNANDGGFSGADDAHTSYNPEMHDLSNKEKRLAAKQLVDAIFQIYEVVNHYAAQGVKYPENKLVELHESGVLDMNMEYPIPHPDGSGITKIPLISLIKNINESAESHFTVTDEFKDKVREPMIREFMKHDIGLSDAQFLMVTWAQEIVQKGIMFFQIRSEIKKVIAGGKALMTEMRKTAAPNPPPTTAASTSAEDTFPEDIPESGESDIIDFTEVPDNEESSKNN